MHNPGPGISPKNTAETHLPLIPNLDQLDAREEIEENTLSDISCEGPDNVDEDDHESPRSLSKLKEYHTVFVVDDTGSMRLPAQGDFTGVRILPQIIEGPTRWQIAIDALSHIAEEAVKHDESGIDIYFLIKSMYMRQGVKNAEEVRNLLGKIDLRENRGATYFEPVLRAILGGHLREYSRAAVPGSNIDLPRPLVIIFLTDGVARDKTRAENVIMDAARRLEEMGAYSNQVGIQFVQVGEDKNAATFLKHLDDDLEEKCERDVSRGPPSPPPRCTLS